MTVSGSAGRREDADVESSSERYARRFSGAVGAYFLDVQARATLQALERFSNAQVLDVGGGHAQNVAPVLAAGHSLTVLGSAPACRERLRPWLERREVSFEVGDLLALPFSERSFDVVLCYRLLPHVEDWPRLVAELTRVARLAVVIDYPTRRSVNAVADALFALKRGVEGDTRPYRVFADRELQMKLHAAGFVPTLRRPQFFLPMALHRALRTARLSRALESLAGALGLVRALGSPVILKAQRA